MPTRAFAGEIVGGKVYSIGRVGIDTTPSGEDEGGPFTATLRTERASPAGEHGLCSFRRVAVRIWRTGAFVCTLKAFVDNAQTQVHSLDTLNPLVDTVTDQAVTFTYAAPTSSPEETLLEMDIAANGSYIQVEIDINSNATTGVWLPESVEIHYKPLREAKSRSDAQAE